MKKPPSLAVLAILLLSSLGLHAQEFLSSNEVPDALEHIELPPYFGLDFSGGYQIGDTVANFQIYNVDGESIRLSDVLAEGKYVILTTGSSTCTRFVETFNLDSELPNSTACREYMMEHMEDFSWIWVYGYEAHPGDVENCTSNCPEEVVPAPTGDTLYQHELYVDRIHAIEFWYQLSDNPDYNFDFPFEMYADNPDNGFYNNFLQRPYGSVVLDCQGVVKLRCPWTSFWLGQGTGASDLDSLLSVEMTCSPGPFQCEPGDLDTDEDGVCDDQELWQGWNPLDPGDNGDPFVFEDVTHISGSEDHVVSIFPNPFDDVLYIKIAEPAEVVIRDTHGRIVKTSSVSSSSPLILEALTSGLYLISITTASGRLFSKMVIKH